MAYKNVITDSKAHNKDNFIYIVHAISSGDSALNLTHARKTVDMIFDPCRFFPTSLVGILDSEAAKAKFGWTNGDIKQTSIYNVSFGLIISPATEDDIHIAWHGDIDSPRNHEALAAFAIMHKGKIREPLELLTRTIVRNEVILRGSPQHKIQGLFVLDESNTEREGEKFNIEISRENSIKFMDLLRKETGEELPIVEEQHYYDNTRAEIYWNEVHNKFAWPKLSKRPAILQGL
jgi:hypothetical protein